jgi:hypothetical protein
MNNSIYKDEIASAKMQEHPASHPSSRKGWNHFKEENVMITFFNIKTNPQPHSPYSYLS